MLLISVLDRKHVTESEDTCKLVAEQLDKDNEKLKEVNDPCIADGLICFKVDNISKIKKAVMSASIFIRNLPW